MESRVERGRERRKIKKAFVSKRCVGELVAELALPLDRAKQLPQMAHVRKQKHGARESCMQHGLLYTMYTRQSLSERMENTLLFLV